MKSILALATMALVSLMLEEKSRQLAGEAHGAYSQAVQQARNSSAAMTHEIRRQPMIALAVAAVVGYLVSVVVPRR